MYLFINQYMWSRESIDISIQVYTSYMHQSVLHTSIFYQMLLKAIVDKFSNMTIHL